MATRRFELTTTVPVDPADAIDFLLDLVRHRGLHAFLESAEVVATGADDLGKWCDWLVVDRLKMGPVPYTFRYVARVTHTAPTSMRSRVRAAPGCFVESTTHAETIDGATRLSEATLVTAPAIAIRYMAKNAEAAHAQTFDRLPAVLAGG